MQDFFRSLSFEHVKVIKFIILFSKRLCRCFYDVVHQHSIHVVYTINVRKSYNNDNTTVILMDKVNHRYLPFIII